MSLWNYFHSPAQSRNGIDFLLTKCFYHQNGVTDRRKQLARTVFSAFITIQQGINLFFNDEGWTAWTGNYEKENSKIQGIYRIYFMSIAIFYTAVLYCYVATSGLYSYRYLIQVIEELGGINPPKLTSLNDDRMRDIRVVITKIMSVMKFIIRFCLIYYSMKHLRHAISFYGWTPMLSVGLFWTVILNIWLYIFMTGAVGAVVTVVLINIAFNSWLNQKIEELHDDNVIFEEKLTDCVKVLSCL